ncbi:MAG: ABC transporter ATP-binding protein [Deltaproteobacteria bacterium]|nr:ABC transporter ATP-binding protein [Deltaproteobacteria bacterium]
MISFEYQILKIYVVSSFDHILVFVSAVLEIVNLSKSFDSILFKDISFKLREGELLTIVGYSGSGKSTLLKILCGLENPDSGSVLLSGIPISKQLGRVVMVFQSYALWPHLTVIENVTLPLIYKGMSKEHAIQKAKAVLSLLQISQLFDRLPHQISGGQQQRVALARALAYEPSFILFDEPFANLDPGLRRSAVQDIKHFLQTLSIGAILVTHNVDDAIDFSDFFCVLHKGEFFGPNDFDYFYFSPPNIEVASIFGQTTFVKKGEKIVATRPEFITVKREGDYVIEEVKKRKNVLTIKARKDNIKSLIEIREPRESYRPGDSISIIVPEEYIIPSMVTR